METLDTRSDTYRDRDHRWRHTQCRLQLVAMPTSPRCGQGPRLTWSVCQVRFLPRYGRSRPPP